MHLDEVHNGQSLEACYTVRDTPYTWHPAHATIRRDTLVARAETTEMMRRFGGYPLDRVTALGIDQWLKDVWAKRTALALLIGEAP